MSSSEEMGTLPKGFDKLKFNSERAELGLEGEEVEEADEMLDENLETLHPNKMRRTHSRNGDLLGDQVGIEDAMDVLKEFLFNLGWTP